MLITDNSKRNNGYKYAAVGLFAGLFLCVIFTFKDYGIAWDEHFHLAYGKYIYDYYMGLLHGHPDLSALNYQNLYLYGGAYDLFAMMMAKFIRHFVFIGEVEVHHLINGLIGVVGIIGAWFTARLLAGDKAAFWTALFLSIVPAYYGHMFLNPKDIPFAAGYIWSLYFILRVVKNPLKINWLSILLISTAIGLTSAIRVGGLILLGYFGLGLVWSYLITCRQNQAGNIWGFLRHVFMPLTITLFLTWGVMLALWPWAQLDPIANPFRALIRLSEIAGPLVVLYRGHLFPTNQVPLDYLLGYFAVTLPELWIAVLLIGLVIFIRKTFRQKNIFSSLSFSGLGSSLLVLAVIIPPLIAILGNPILYDGIRHFLFILPPLSCLTGIAFQTMLDRIYIKRKSMAVVIQVLVGLYLLVHVSILVQLHPYEYIYYNSLVGGTRGASQRFETDYWGTAGSEAARWLTSYLVDNRVEPYGKIQVYYCDDPSSVTYYLPKQIKITRDPNQADFFIGGIREFCNDQVAGKKIFSVTRMGVDLSVIKILR